MLSGTLGMSTAVPACQVGGLAFSDVVGTNHCIVMCSYSVNKERNLTISPLLNKPTDQYNSGQRDHINSQNGILLCHAGLI